MAKKVKQLFDEIEAIWGVIPSYVKVFLYSTISSAFGLWVAKELNWTTVAIIVASNLGLYQIPRTIGTQTIKIMNKDALGSIK